MPYLEHTCSYVYIQKKNLVLRTELTVFLDGIVITRR